MRCKKAELARGYAEEQVEKDTQVMVGDPEEEPEELLDAVCAFGHCNTSPLWRWQSPLGCGRRSLRALGKTGIARENANMGNLISEETLHKMEADTSFQQLSQKMQTLNIFEVLGITNAEIRHSNFLAWLLDPNGNHGMGDKFLREFVSKLGQREVVPENVTVCIVRREWQHIDLLVLCQKEKYLLCVEK